MDSKLILEAARGTLDGTLSFCQCWFNAFVIFASHVRSCNCSSSSDAAKYFTLFGGVAQLFCKTAPMPISTICDTTTSNRQKTIYPLTLCLE
jgi:hypothetical protein